MTRFWASSLLLLLLDATAGLIPDIVHQIYDYNSPNFFLYLSLQCVQTYMRPAQHIVWINSEGRQRKQQWHNWLDKHSSISTQYTWEANFTSLFNSGKVEARFIVFPSTPPGNDSVYVSNKAHRSDFMRMQLLQSFGGVYLDTDAFVTSYDIHLLREHEFVLGFDNIVFPKEDRVPHKLNNGVILSMPNASFLELWRNRYRSFDPSQWDMHSSIVPYELAMAYPDLIHIETHRISPFSFGFQTAKAAIALVCGIMDPLNGTIWSPRYDKSTKSYTYEDTTPDPYIYRSLSKKVVLHLTMSQVRGISFMRKNLNDPKQLGELFPSYLGRLFRVAMYQIDHFDYRSLHQASNAYRLKVWQTCRHAMGMHYAPEGDQGIGRHQYFAPTIT